MKKTQHGRPSYEPVLPKGNFTFVELAEANGVDPKTGKGKNCSALTLRKWLKREEDRKGRSAIVRLANVEVENTTDGRGRRAFVYAARKDKNETQEVIKKTNAVQEQPARTEVNGAVTTAFLLGNETVSRIQQLVGNDPQKIAAMASLIAKPIHVPNGSQIIMMEHQKVKPAAPVPQAKAATPAASQTDNAPAPTWTPPQTEQVHAGELVAA